VFATDAHLLKNPAMNRPAATTTAAAALRATLLAVSFALASSWSCAPKADRPAHAGRSKTDQSKLQRYSFNQSGVGVDFRVVVYCADLAAARQAQAVVAKRLDKLGDLLDRSRPTSELAQVEENAGLGSVRVSDEFYALFRQLDRLSTQSNGALDVTTGAAAALWKDSVEAGELPTDDAVAHARKSIGQEKLHLDAVNRTVALTSPGMRFDVDDIVAAYACDCIMEALNLAGFPIALVDAGRASSGRAGCILVGDAPPGQPGWRVFIDDADPRVPEHKVTLTRNAIVSSGRLCEIIHIGAAAGGGGGGGGDYASLIDPHSGIGSRNLATVTVAAPHAWLAAALARGAAVLGEANGRGFIRGTPGAIGWFHYPLGATRPTITVPATQPMIGLPGQPAPFLRRSSPARPIPK
jgi:thiamine biosynthesis lipoprotein